MRSWWIALVPATAALSSIALAQDASNPKPIEGNATLDATELPQRLVKVLRTTNKAQTNRYFPRVYEFKNVNPFAVIRFVRRFMEIEEGAWYSFANEDMKSGKILCVCPEYQLAGLDEMMAQLDRADLTSSGGDKRAMFQPKHRDVSDPGFIGELALAGTPTVIALPDTQINGMYLEESPSGFESVGKAWAEFDVPTANWEAITTVYEIDLTDDGTIGLDYVSWKNGPGRNLFAAGAFAQREKIDNFDARAKKQGAGSLIYNSGKGVYGLPESEYESTGRNLAYMYDVPSAYFDYLASNGYGRTMTRAKLTALTGATASLEIGEETLFYKVNHAPDQRAGARIEPLDPYGNLEPFTDTSATGEKTDTYGVKVADYPDNRTVVPTLQPRTLGSVKSGFFLQLQPIIHANLVTVTFNMSIVDITGYQDDGTPVLASRTANTVFRLPPSPNEITIGGLVRSRRNDGANQMPGLGDIPILGYLFGGKSKLDQKSMIVVTMKSRIPSLGEDARTPEELEAEAKAMGGADTSVPATNPGIRPN